MPIFDMRLLDTVVLSVVEPNTIFKVSSKHCLELSIIKSAPFLAGFLEMIWVI